MLTLRVGNTPVELLRRVHGLPPRQLPPSDSCRGFGGPFAINNADERNVTAPGGVEALRSQRHQRHRIRSTSAPTTKPTRPEGA